jgi:hypothetical protein
MRHLNSTATVTEDNTDELTISWPNWSAGKEILCERHFRSTNTIPFVVGLNVVNCEEMLLSNCLNVTDVRLAQTGSSNRYIIGMSDISIGTSVTQHAMKVHGRMELQLHVFLNSALRKCKQSDSRPNRFTTEAAAPFSCHVADCLGQQPVCLMSIGKSSLAPASNWELC